MLGQKSISSKKHRAPEVEFQVPPFARALSKFYYYWNKSKKELFSLSHDKLFLSAILYFFSVSQLHNDLVYRKNFNRTFPYKSVAHLILRPEESEEGT